MTGPSDSSYGLTLDDDDMAPMYYRGDTIIADPEREIVPGNSIVVWFKDETRAPIVRVLKEWVHHGLILDTVADPRRLEGVNVADVDRVHGISAVYRGERVRPGGRLE